MKRLMFIILSLYFICSCGDTDFARTGAQSGVSDKSQGDTLTAEEFTAVKNTADTADALATVNESAIATLDSEVIKAEDFTQDSGVLVGTGAGTYQEETGATARISLGITGDIITSDLKDEDDMSSDSATDAASQQSIKAYVDTTADQLDGETFDLSGSLTEAFLIGYDEDNSQFDASAVTGAISLDSVESDLATFSLTVSALIGDTAFTDLDDGSNYSNFSGSADDDTLNELFAAIDSSLSATYQTKVDSGATAGYLYDGGSGLVRAGTNVTIDDDGNYITINASLAGGVVDTSGTLNADEIAVMFDADTIKSLTEAEFKTAYNMEAGTDFLAPAGDGSALTSVDAATGDSATAFFDAGAIEHEYGGLERDVSGDSGLIAISGGSTLEVDSKSELEDQIADVADFAEADGDTYSGAHDFSSATLTPPTMANSEFIPIGWFVFDGSGDPDVEMEEDNIRYRDFDDVTAEEGEFVWRAPENLTGSTIKVRAIAVVTNATPPPDTYGVSWGIAACSSGTNDTHDCTIGTEVNSEDTDLDDDAGSQWDLIFFPYVAVTPTNLTAGELVKIAIQRDVADSDDDYAQDIGLIGVDIKYQYNPYDMSY